MNEELITLTTAKFAKKKGFDWGAKMCWLSSRDEYYDGKFMESNSVPYIGEGCEYIYAPTQSFLQKWLREKHNIVVNIDWIFIGSTLKWRSSISRIKEIGETNGETRKNYGKAFEEGLKKALKLIDN